MPWVHLCDAQENMAHTNVHNPAWNEKTPAGKRNASWLDIIPLRRMKILSGSIKTRLFFRTLTSIHYLVKW
jgi:hypothetical protein